MTDLMIIIALTVAACLLVGAGGIAVLHLVRRRSLRYQLAIVTLLPVLAVAGTVLVNVWLMFLSPHDTTVILVALLTALLLAIGGAWLVVRRVTRASAQVGAGLSLLVADSAVGSSAARTLRRCAPTARRPSWPRCSTTWPRPGPPWPSRGNANGPPSRRAASWSPSCRTICVRRWPGCAPSPRDSRTG